MKKTYLIMLPGWGMQSTVWQPLHEMLSSDFELLFVDWNDVTSTEGYKEKVIHLIGQTQINSNSFSILGWSLGSLVALELATHYSSQINWIILISGTSRFTIQQEDQYACGWHKKIIERMQFQLEKNQQETLSNFYKAMFSSAEKSSGQEQRFFHMLEQSMLQARALRFSQKVRSCSTESPFEDFPSIKENSNLPDTNSLRIGLDYLIQSDLRDELERIQIPMLLLHGKEDQICPLAAAKYINSKKKSTKLVVLEQTGHIPFFTHPRLCYEAISEFVKTYGEGAFDD